MEGGKDLVKEVFVFLVVVGNRYIRYSWTELSERLSRFIVFVVKESSN